MVNWLLLTVLPFFGAGVIRLLGRTMTLTSRGEEPVDDLHRRGQPIILAFWHAHQLMIPLGYRGKGTHILISRHRDGEIIARIVARFGHRAVRGSSTRGGASALRDLIRLGRAGADLVVTPDGPKGPRQEAKLGVIQLARATGLPIVPLAFSCSKKNSSRAGIGSWSPIPSAAACFNGASRSGCRVRRPRRRWKPGGATWRQS
jgi:lysophospholipid acyltransferase (LPLAT)-like uncharacterized protein